MLKTKIKILTIIIIAMALRIFFAINLPLSGDEAGCGMLQASGQAAIYKYTGDDLISKEITSVRQIKKFINYSKDYSLKDVFLSLKYYGHNPPFYYLILRCLLKYIGDGTFILRLVSIFISLLCILFIYLLGKVFYSENAGFYSALFFAISAYGVVHGTMVRPYPLAMFLSMVTTLQMYKLDIKNSLSFNSLKLFLYIFTVTIGFYTTYHFLFVFIFQMVFLIMQNLHNRKTLLIIAAMVAIIFIFYLSWMPVLSYHLKDVIQHEYYFHGTVSLPSAIKSIINLNFIKHIPYTINIFIPPVIYIIILIGCCFLLKDKKKRGLLLALGVYLASWYIVDKKLSIRTMNMGKLLFFIAPILFILLGIGVSKITKRYYLRIIFVLFCCSLLLSNSISIATNRYKPIFDGPAYLGIFKDKINNFLKQSQKGLIIINTSQRRILFSFSHAIEYPSDIKIIHAKSLESDMLGIIGKLNNYDSVFIINSYIFYENQSFFSPEDIKIISNYLTMHGFSLVRSFESGGESDNGLLMVFKK